MAVRPCFSSTPADRFLFAGWVHSCRILFCFFLWLSEIKCNPRAVVLTCFWGPLECCCSKFVFENIWKSSYHKKVGVGLSEMEKPTSEEGVVRFYSAVWSWVWLQVMSGKKLTGIFYFCIRDLVKQMIRSICRPSINSTLQRAAFFRWYDSEMFCRMRWKSDVFMEQ